MIRLYGLTGCGPCEVTRLFLQQKGADFTFLDISQDETARQRVRELVGSPNAGVVLEVDGRVEALKGVSLPRLEAWYWEYQQSHTAS